MNIHLTPDAFQFVESLVAAGQYPTANEAVADGVRLLIARNKLREEIQIGIDDIENGRIHSHEEVFAELRATAASLASSSRESI